MRGIGRLSTRSRVDDAHVIKVLKPGISGRVAKSENDDLVRRRPVVDQVKIERHDDSTDALLVGRW